MIDYAKASTPASVCHEAGAPRAGMPEDLPERRHNLPVMVGSSADVMAGGLISFGPDNAEIFRRTAAHVDQILKGAKPGDLSVELPTKFELAVNLKTAKMLGLKIPPSVLLRADRVVE
jgi:putative ABC transport system substrate-binding protein